jgi:polysaccharide export outer membrane protein
MKRIIILVLSLVLIAFSLLYADEPVVVDRSSNKSTTVNVDVGNYLPQAAKTTAESKSAYGEFDPLKYTLGPNDLVEIEVLRHPEFSGKFVVNQDGKIQYKLVGDIEVKGLTKVQLADKLKTALSQYVISPEINVSIVEFGSKTFFVMGEVASPGQHIMKAETISLRDAIYMAGLPTANAAIRKCKLITPSETGNPKIKYVDLYSLLYVGDLRKNVMIKAGDILYVPATVMAKVIRVISPATTVIGLSSSMPESAASGKTAVDSLRRNSAFY